MSKRHDIMSAGYKIVNNMQRGGGSMKKGSAGAVWGVLMIVGGMVEPVFNYPVGSQFYDRAEKPLEITKTFDYRNNVFDGGAGIY